MDYKTDRYTLTTSIDSVGNNNKNENANFMMTKVQDEHIIKIFLTFCPISSSIYSYKKKSVYHQGIIQQKV